MRISTKSSILGFAALIGAASLVGTANANLVVDGNFDTPSGGTTFTTYSSPFGGWTVGGSVDLIGGYWQAPPGGGGSVDLDGNSVGSISQVLNLTAGQDYNLSFAFAGNPDGGPTTKDFSVSINGATSNFSFDTTGASLTTMNFKTASFDFIATGGPTTLSFTSLDTSASPFYGAAIGNVSVTAVPEPATAALVMLGLGVLGFAARRRRDDSIGGAAA